MITLLLACHAPELPALAVDTELVDYTGGDSAPTGPVWDLTHYRGEGSVTLRPTDGGYCRSEILEQGVAVDVNDEVMTDLLLRGPMCAYFYAVRPSDDPTCAEMDLPAVRYQCLEMSNHWTRIWGLSPDGTGNTKQVLAIIYDHLEHGSVNYEETILQEGGVLEYSMLLEYPDASW